MNEYVTEEQQVEALKKWWAENGRYLIGGVVLGLAILFGWNSWKEYRENRAKDASAIFAELNAAVTAANEAKARELQGKLVNDYASTPYAASAELMMAKMAVGQNDLNTAELNLRSAIELSPQQELTEIAELRLASVLIAQKKLDEALQILDKEWPAAYISLRDELQGDVYVAQGKFDAAREAYDKAILTAGSQVEFLRLKRNALGTGAKVTAEAAS